MVKKVEYFYLLEIRFVHWMSYLITHQI